VQKQVLHRYLLNFSLGICGLILLSDFKTYFSNLKSIKLALKSLMQYLWILTLSPAIYFKFLDALWASQLNLKFCSKQHNKIFVLHLIVAPQLSSGWRPNYSTKTRQVSCANEQYVYSLMSMGWIMWSICFAMKEKQS
jgi:hypothetical protein